MKNAISYSLFGFNRAKDPNCFDFESYLRGLMINIRLNRLVYPGWDVVVNMDHQTYNGFSELFDALPIVIKLHPNDHPLCLAMLWRLAPVYDQKNNGEWKYDHVLCRDLDSPTTYRERQCVEQWIANDKSMHAITDSVSHNIPLMGGMIGIKPAYFTMRMPKTWQQLIDKHPGFNFVPKGSDQTFLNQHVYPEFAHPGNESITQHYILGHPNTFLNDWHDKVPNIVLNDVDDEIKESNDICGHIGAAGYYPPPLHKFLNKHHAKFEDLQKAEQPFANIFYWRNQNLF